MHPRPTRILIAITLLVGTSAALVVQPKHAAADVTHGIGFEATVAGWTSWYGSYRLAGIGTVWCIDHGLQAPDAAFGYRPTAPPALPAPSRTAMAWILGRYGASADAIDAAAIMLVLHDLNRAVYPQGPLQVDRLTAGQLAGFDGAENRIRERAIRIRADGSSHAMLRGPITLSLTTSGTPGAGNRLGIVAGLHDADGRGVAGIPLTIHALGASPASAMGTTGADGILRVPAIASADRVHVTADATIPSLDLAVFGPAGAPAQRVARANVRQLHASLALRTPRTRFRIRKTGDAEPRHPVTGAQFVITVSGSRTVATTLTVGPDGQTPWASLPSGRYTVSEAVAPDGYERAQPIEVTIGTSGDQTLEVVDHIRRPTLQLRKVDVATGEPLVGAILRIWEDPDGDGEFTPLGEPIVTTEDPVTLTTLLPGDYRISEVRPPRGYSAFTPRDVHLDPGAQVEVELPDRPVPPTVLLPPTTAERTPPPATSTPPASTTTPPPVPPATGGSFPPPPPATNEFVPMLPLTGTSTLPLFELGVGILLIGVTLVMASSRATEADGFGR